MAIALIAPVGKDFGNDPPSLPPGESGQFGMAGANNGQTRIDPVQTSQKGTGKNPLPTEKMIQGPVGFDLAWLDGHAMRDLMKGPHLVHHEMFHLNRSDGELPATKMLPIGK